MNRYHQRITLFALLFVGVISLVILSSNSKTVGENLHFLDNLTHTPIVINKPEDQTQNSNNEIIGETKSETKGESDEEKKPEDIMDPCTVINPLNRGFIDLRGISAFGNEGKPLPLGAKGYDSGVNFTLGICSTPMKKIHEPSELQDDIDSSKIGGYYKDPKTGLYVSIGEFNTSPVFRGRKLTLTYENGSYCNLVDSKTGLKVKKSTIITLVCDREMLSKAAVSYIGNVNECDYMFEVRSHHVCPTAAKANNMNAVWIFLLIVIATIVGYFSGGILYRQMKAKKVGI
ncbi:hypothetical protein CLIB1444_09S00254 [[Candida] jaroonii]|uniref:Uncharacterized protein n=1 Tax=[Candida] jaroonii TaxID=467808 RepID=A0ACA9YBP0_9ASCO|nr:hypothetical protein CLIB1444_09S00254 [[Candida] jaroonii]